MIAQTNDGTLRTEFDKPDYAVLAASQGQPCISIYTAPLSEIEASKQDVTRLTALLRTLQDKFSNDWLTLEMAEAILRSNWQLLQERTLAHRRTRTLAIFMNKSFFACYHLLSAVPEYAVVGGEFHIRPLLPLLPVDDRFFLLALSQNHVKLYQGSYHGLTERNVAEIPESLREDLSDRTFEQGYESHTAASASSTTKGAIFHGTHQDRKEQLLHFFRHVNQGIADSLKGQEAPLVVASVDYLFPIYKVANTYPHLLENAVAGNPDILSPDSLHDAAWKIVEENVSKTRDRAFAVYAAHINTPLASSNLREILNAANRGLIRFLFVPPVIECWGRLVAPDVVHVHAHQEPGDDDLLNLAAIHTIRHGGHVHVISPTQLREGAEVAAVFRYGLDSKGIAAA